MKTYYRFIIIIILLILSSGCANDGIYRAIYEESSRSNLQNGYEDDPIDNITREKKSYNAYKREREEMLKEDKISEEQIEFFTKQDISNEIKQEEVNEDNVINE